MNIRAALPTYSEEHLSGLAPAALIDLMVADEDRVPRAVIDACSRRGDDMTVALQELLERPWAAPDAIGEWWLRLHVVMILGLIPSESAGVLAVRFMRAMSAAQDDDMQDWLAGYWPALFINKPDTVLQALHELCGDQAIDGYPRTNAMEAIVATAERRGPAALDEALAWVSRFAVDDNEYWDMRISCGNTLLNFPRASYRTLLESLAERQTGLGVFFLKGDVDAAYATLEDAPEWRGFDDPWAFYEPEAIAERAARWSWEDGEGAEGVGEVDGVGDHPVFDDLFLPYIRTMPKVGRNDPCPCGSGKKYKKCCLLTEGTKAG